MITRKVSINRLALEISVPQKTVDEWFRRGYLPCKRGADRLLHFTAEGLAAVRVLALLRSTTWRVPFRKSLHILKLMERGFRETRKEKARRILHDTPWNPRLRLFLLVAKHAATSEVHLVVGERLGLVDRGTATDILALDVTQLSRHIAEDPEDIASLDLPTVRIA